MKHNELLQRIITGFILSVAGILIISFSGYPFVVNTCVAILCVASVFELYKAAGFHREYFLLILISAIGVAVSFIEIPYYFRILVIIYPFVIAFFQIMMIKKEKFVKFAKQGALFTPCGIVILLFHSLIDIRHLENGLIYLSFAILCCCLTDIFAYVFGKSLGKHKLVPKISPKKTWEGSIGGTFSAIVILILLALIVQHFSNYNFNFGILIAYTIIVSAFSQFGDLSMSIVKRICGIKDFGTIFPGHGGVLDRFDSQLIAVPLAFILCAVKGFVF